MIAFANSAFAALPPFYQTAKEIKAILESSEVADKLGSGRAISSIVREGSNYLVTAGDCALDVQIVYVSPPKPGFVGPAQFELHVGQVHCLP